MLTQQRLRESLSYDPNTGIFRWRYSHIRRVAGREVGNISVHGYKLITIDNEKFRASRLAWLYMTGEWPKADIDHINGDPADDKWSNLRAATESENMRNTKLRADNTSGSRGVSWNKRRNKWHVRVNVNNMLYHVGYFDDFGQAKAARDAKASILHGAFARFDQLPATEGTSS